MQASIVRYAVTGARLVVCGSILALASFVFLQSLSPHQPAESRTGAQPLTRQRVSVVKVPAQARLYYYVVASEQQAKQLQYDRMAASDYYGAGYPTTPPVVVVARTQEVFDSLRDLLAKTSQAGGPPYTLFDMR